jgi:hypothetical protein
MQYLHFAFLGNSKLLKFERFVWAQNAKFEICLIRNEFRSRDVEIDAEQGDQMGLWKSRPK